MATKGTSPEVRKSPPKLEAWDHDGVEEVVLDHSKRTIWVLPLDLPRAFLGGRIHSQLSVIAERHYYDDEFDATKLVDAKEREAWEDYVDWAVADSINAAADLDPVKYGPRVTLEYVKQVRDGQKHMPLVERIQVFKVATHQGLAQRLGAQDLEKFRDILAGALPATNGEAQGSSAE